MKSNPKGRPQKSNLSTADAAGKKPAKTLLRHSTAEKGKPLVYKMPPQQQWFLKGKDKDCL